MAQDPGWSFKIAGVTFNNDDGSSRQELVKRMRIPCPVELRREPKNKFDKNAVGVWTAKGQIGYVPRTVNVQLLAWLKEHPNVVCVATFVGSVPGKDIKGVRVKVSEVDRG